MRGTFLARIFKKIRRAGSEMALPSFCPNSTNNGDNTCLYGEKWNP
jgi:hypothetical protein